jgi:2-aminoadipate transaminase
MEKINFLRGVPADEALIPVADLLAEEYKKVIQDHGSKVIQYQTPGLTDFNGFVPLKKLLAERFGIKGDPQARVICSNGGMETFSLLMKSFETGSLMATEALTYDRVLSDIKRLGHRTVGIPLSNEGVDLDALREILDSNDIKVFYQVAYHHNPVGFTASVENMEAASQICAENGVLHVLDIAYFELRYDGIKNRLVSMTNFPETTCLVGSFTKTISPGSKCGFGFFPDRVVAQMTPVIANTRLNPNYPTQAAIHGIMQSGVYDQHLAFLSEFYKPRMESANKGLKEFLPELNCPELKGGFFVGIWLPGIKTDQTMVDAAGEKGVLLAPANAYAPGMDQHYLEEKGGVFFRLTFPALSPEANLEGIKRIAEAYRELT